MWALGVRWDFYEWTEYKDEMGNLRHELDNIPDSIIYLILSPPKNNTSLVISLYITLTQSKSRN